MTSTPKIRLFQIQNPKNTLLIPVCKYALGFLLSNVMAEITLKTTSQVYSPAGTLKFFFFLTSKPCNLCQLILCFVRKSNSRTRLVNLFCEFDLPCYVLVASLLYQFSSVQFSSVQFSSVQFSSVQFSSVQFSSVQFSSVQFSSVQFSSVQFSSVQFSSVQFSSVQFSSVQFSSVQFSSVQFSSVQFSSVQFSSVQFSSVQFSSVHIDIGVT